MLQRKINRGTLPPLFERIVDDKSGVTPLNQLLNAKELQESIVHELSIILNTRCTVRKVIYEDHIETIPFFGLPDFFGLADFSYFDGANPEDWSKAARFIETAIHAAEPRLQNIHVKVEIFDIFNQSLNVTVSAFIREFNLLKEIHFPLELQNRNTPFLKSAA